MKFYPSPILVCHFMDLTNSGLFLELLPGQAHIFKRILEKGAYNLPSDAGVYRLCMNYENNKKSMRNIDLWVGKIDSCAVLKIQERR